MLFRSYEDVKAINPRIVYCGMFGFGQDGRYRAKPAFDGIIQGASGMAGLFQRSGDRPRNVPLVAADKVVGLIAVQMITMALLQRTRTHEGCAIEIPMFENFVKFIMEEHMYLQTFQPPLGGTGDPRLLDPKSGPLQTKDGYICITATTELVVARPTPCVPPRVRSPTWQPIDTSANPRNTGLTMAIQTSSM